MPTITRMSGVKSIAWFCVQGSPSFLEKLGKHCDKTWSGTGLTVLFHACHSFSLFWLDVKSYLYKATSIWVSKRWVNLLAYCCSPGHQTEPKQVAESISVYGPVEQCPNPTVYNWNESTACKAYAVLAIQRHLRSKNGLCFACCGLVSVIGLALLHAESHQLVPWSLSSPPQSSSSGVASDRCDLTWHDKLQAQTNTLQPLLDRFPGLTLLGALCRSSRQAKIARIAVSATHDCLLSIFNVRDILCNANGSPLWRHVQPRPLSTTSGWSENGCNFHWNLTSSSAETTGTKNLLLVIPRFKNIK